MEFKVLFLISTCFMRQLHANFIEEKMKFNLPPNLEPEKYEIDLYTNVVLEKPHFYGKVSITIKCNVPTKQIVLNSDSLVIDKVEVWLKSEKDHKVPVYDIDGDMKDDQIILKLREYLQKDNRYEVQINYHKANFYSKLLGYIFRQYEGKSYINYLAYTQINEIEARRLWPCWDQIGIKSKFVIRHRHPALVKSFSNAKKIVEREPVNEPIGWVVDKFADIESMSTFSVAFVVADYNSIGPAQIPTGVPKIDINIWAEDDALKKMGSLLIVSSRCYFFFASIFRIPHKLEKLDLIVVSSINVEVQDSFGLIILRQDEVLKTFDESNLSILPKHSLISKLCYAMSRQWIGHSVTMSAWSETWLHYGLNTLLQNWCIDDLFPGWRIISGDQLVESFFILLRAEDRGNYNPVVSLGPDSFFTPQSKSQNTYSKIHLVIRMLSLILQSENDVFRKSIQKYVTEFESKNTNVDKTWEIFTKTVNDEDASLLPENVTVKKIMDTWLLQKGHPHLNVKMDKETNEIVVTQEYFNFSHIGKEIGEEEKCWIIPLSFTTKEKREFENVKVQEWLRCHSESVRIKNVNVNEWIVFNLKLFVPLRVNYENSIWLSIQGCLLNPKEYSQIDYLSRAQFISDMFVFAEAKILTYEFLFDTLEYLKYEEDYNCWKVAISELKRIKVRWTGTLLYSSYMQYVRDILRPVLQKKVLKGTILTILDFLNTKSSNAAFENMIILAACMFETYECVQLTQKLQYEWKALTYGKYSRLIPNIMCESVFCLAVKNADIIERDFLFSRYDFKHKPSSQPNKHILTALGCSSKTEILQKYLAWGMDLDDNAMSAELRLTVFDALSSNELAYPLITYYLKTNHKDLENYLKTSGSSITIEHFLIKAIEATKVQNVYEKLIELLPTNERRNKLMIESVEESTSKTERNIQWLQKKQNDMINYFNPE